MDQDQRFEVVSRATECLNHMQEQLEKCEANIETIVDKHIAELSETTSQVDALLKGPLMKKDTYEDILSQLENLQYLLHFNSKLDDCIFDSARHSEAMQMIDYINELNKKSSFEFPFITKIHLKSEKQREILALQLCNKLERFGESTVDEAFEIVRSIAKCKCFSIRQLRLKYLQARDNWFNKKCDDYKESFDDVASFYSEGLVKVFTEYKSIFTDSNYLTSNSSVALDPSTKEDGAFINSWLLLKTTLFISSLELYLDDLNQNSLHTPTMLSDTMQKCFQLTNRLASIGFDFSSELKPMFTKALMKEVRSCIEKATSKFQFSLANATAKSIESLLLPVEDEILRISNMKSREQLPKTIEHYPIFKIYFLHLIDSLRWLHSTKNILSPVNLCLDFYGCLNASLIRATKALAMIFDMDKSSGSNSMHPILTKIAISLVTEVLPFIANYCQEFFPEKVIINSLGLSKSEFKAVNLKNFKLDLQMIVEPLLASMPALVNAVE